jgi:type IV fimbrial biogenesis protein FimT
MDVRNAFLRPMHGLTVIELITTVAVLVVVLAVGVPGMRGFVSRQEVGTAVDGLVGHLQLARVAAVSGGYPVVFCPTIDGSSCSGATSWESGYLVFQDLDGDRRPDAAEPVLRSTLPGAKGVRVLTTAGRLRVVYQPDGTSGGTNLTFRVCPRDTLTAGQAVVVSNVGRPRVAAQESGGGPIRCADPPS